MADGVIQIPADGAGKKLDTEEIVVGANTVHRERDQIAGAGADDIAVVTDTTPASDAHGLVVRQVGTQPVSAAILPLPTGAATEATLAAVAAAQLPDGHAVTVDNFPATQPVSAASLPLPTGAATAANQLATPRSQSGPGQPGTAIDSYGHAAINLAAGANQVLVASAPGKQIWVYGIHFVCSAAGTVSFQDEDDVAISGIMPFAANSGMSVPPSGNFSMPLWKLGTDKDLEVDVVTAEVDGWISYAILSA